VKARASFILDVLLYYIGANCGNQTEINALLSGIWSMNIQGAAMSIQIETSGGPQGLLPAAVDYFAIAIAVDDVCLMACHLLSTDRSSQRPIKGAARQNHDSIQGSERSTHRPSELFFA
jgi:hypothetical protein